MNVSRIEYGRAGGWLLALVTLLLGLAGTVEAQGKFPYVGVITNDRVNIRGGGGQNYMILNTVNKGELVEVRGRGGSKREWLRVNYPKPLLAYITTDYVKKVADDMGVVEAQRVHLRPSASTLHYPLRTLKIGTRLRITGEKNGFYQVVVPDDTDVWIHQDYVRYFGALQEYGDKLQKMRADALKVFTARKAEPPVVKKKPEDPKKAATPGSQASQKPPQAAEEDPAVRARQQLLARHEALRELFAKEQTRKNLKGLKGVRDELRTLENEAKALKDDYSRFMVGFQVNQLVIKVRLAIVDLENELRNLERKKATKQPVAQSIEGGKDIQVAGWLKKESKLFSSRVLYKLEKGNVVLFYITSDKYDLNHFINKHVYVTGEVLPRKNLMDNTFLKVTRLKVLSQ